VVNERFFFPSRLQFGKIGVADEPPLRAGLAPSASISDEVPMLFTTMDCVDAWKTTAFAGMPYLDLFELDW
jgi:hypothetical protein